MDLTNILIIPIPASRVRAVKAAEPTVLGGQIAKRLALNPALVRITLAGGDKPPRKSVAK